MRAIAVLLGFEIGGWTTVRLNQEEDLSAAWRQVSCYSHIFCGEEKKHQ